MNTIKQLYRDTLESIAADSRKTKAQRLASSCIIFVDSMTAEKRKDRDEDKRIQRDLRRELDAGTL